MKVILTGATGMVGEEVLHVCLADKDIEQVLIINRRPSEISHPKIKEIIHKDFYNLSAIENQLVGFDACYFCLGVSSVGMDADEYYKMTYTLTMTFAETLAKHNPNMTFCYISGASTDSTEKGRIRWARVKGKTENDLMKLFKKVYNFRPGAMIASEGMKYTLKYYKYFNWLIPIMKVIMPKSLITLKELGVAMINASKIGYEKQILEINDIRILANRN